MTPLTLHQLRWQHRPADPVSLTIHPGECWGILGANGSGKTSLLHTLMGLLPPTGGQVQLNQIPLSDYPPKARAKMLGLLFQDSPFLFPQTIAEYCFTSRYPHGTCPKDDERVQSALELLHLTALQHRRLTHLSGGEKRRAALAALLVQSPHIFLLDEPNNHLDLAHQHRCLSHFKQLTHLNQQTVIMTLHEPNLAATYCTHLLLLFEDGSHLQGECAALMTEANLSRLYHFCGIKNHSF